MVKAYEALYIDTIGGRRKVTNEHYLPLHTTQCHETQKRLRAERDEFIKEYPNACRTCRCYSLHGSSYDPWSGAYYADECEDCSGNDICPLCGDPNFGADGDYERCVECDWQYDSGPFMPDPNGCVGCGKGSTRYG